MHLNSTLPVHEVFHTFQGEGVHMGHAAFFIRTFGCPVHCPWCDSAGTWHKNYVPPGIDRMEVGELAMEAASTGSALVVITGGEPCIHDLDPLIEACHAMKLVVHLETSGGFPIPAGLDWVTLSPKRWKPPLVQNLLKAHEFKIIVEKPDDIDFYSKMIGMDQYAHPHVWLHPEWSKREDKKVLSAIATAVKWGKGHYRAGWQVHKLYQVDGLDKRSRPLVPLGGDESKGY